MYIRTSLVILLLPLSFAKAENLSKKQAFESMKKNSPRWQQTKLLSEEAMSQTQMAKAATGPQVVASSREFVAKINQLQYGFPEQGNLTYVSFGNTGLSMGYNVFDAAGSQRIELAQKNLEMNEAQRDQYQADLTFMMIAQYLNIARLDQKLSNMELNIQRDEEILKAAHMKVKVGAGVRLEEIRAKNLLEFDRIKKIDLQNQILKAKMDLAQTIGQVGHDFQVDKIHFKDLSDSKAAPQRRSDLIVAEKTVQMAEENKEVHEKELWPKITLFGEAGLSGVHVIGGSSVLTGSFGVQVSMPIYDSGLGSARRTQADIKLRHAQLQQKNLEFEAQSQSESSGLQLQNAKKTYQLSLKQLEAAEVEMSMAQKRFQAGSSSGFEISTAQTSLSNARDLQCDALFGYEISKLNYFKAQGNIQRYLDGDL